MKRICVVTATRAEYGLLKPLMVALKESDAFALQLVVTGAHLSPEFGLTYQAIAEDGFVIDAKVEMLLSSDTALGISKSMGLAMISLAEAFDRLAPDAVVILGDRYEMLAVASCAVIAKIPIIHLHGGEVTEGAYDDAIRHAITKMSALHFTSTEDYRQRVIQMGEQENCVYAVGAIGIDTIQTLPFLTKAALAEHFGVTFKKYLYQITFHPETLSTQPAEEQFKQLLQALEQEEDSFFVFTKANADTEGRSINRLIDEYVSKNPNKAIAFHSLGALRFLSLVKVCDAIIGNSSSGILEAPSLQTATVNIGDRQKGRIQARSIVNCTPDAAAISAAIQQVKEEAFKGSLASVVNPYFHGGSVRQIMAALHEHKDTLGVVKHFNDRQ